MGAIKTCTVRINKELLQKFYFIAKQDGVSANGELVKIIKEYIENFEKEHGTIASPNDLN